MCHGPQYLDTGKTDLYGDNMHMSAASTVPDQVHRRRWSILAVSCLAVFVTLLDGTIVNIALPSLA